MRSITHYGISLRVILGSATIMSYFVAFDYLAKIWMRTHHAFMVPYALNHYCNILLVQNRGIAFSLFHQQPQWMAVIHYAVAFIIIGLSWAIFFVPQRHVGIHYALAMILGGALGNYIDRILHGQVLDFISVHYHQYYFAVFNFADVFVSLGLFCLVCYQCCGYEIRFLRSKQASTLN